MGLRRRGVPVDAPEQDLGGEGADGLDVLGDDGDRGIEQVGQEQVVEPDHGGAVLGAPVTQRADRAQGDQVLAAEQRGRRLGTGQQPGGTSLFGGRGAVLGTLFGALIVQVFQSGINLAGGQSLYQVLAEGILVIVAVALDQWIRKVRR